MNRYTASKKVYLEPAWKLPVSYEYMTAHPPQGYQFVVSPNGNRMFHFASRWSQSYDVLNALDSVFPTVLLASWLRRRGKPPLGTVLTWAHGQMVLRPEPWVVEVEYASLLLGPNPKHLKKYRRTLERLLSSPHCRKIRCWCEAGRRTLVTGLDCRNYEHKIETIYPAVSPKRFVKRPEGKNVKLLFVGSGNIKGHFEEKGGRYVLEAFAILAQCYPELELVIRSDMPTSLKATCQGAKNIRIIDTVVPAETLVHEYESSDIFLLPSHTTPPYTILDAMSYELPVVSIDAWANPEFIADGRTGLLAHRSTKVPYYEDACQPRFGTSDFREAIRKSDPAVVEELVKKVSLLIDSPLLRRGLGKAAREEVEHGRFSIGKRNEKLKRLFDEALAKGEGKKGNNDCD